MRPRGQRFHIGLVLLCYFTAALSALGMPPFFGLILSQSLHLEATYLVGFFYILPTLCTALTSPWWGRLADRWGKKTSLLRAQLGLAVGFSLAGFAFSPWFFCLALMVQGIFGGTFSASNAYLSSLLSGESLARSLSLMQASVRAAMVVAPIIFGLLIVHIEPLMLYRYLACLPVLAALLLCFTVAPAKATKRPTTATTAMPSIWPALRRLQLYQLQFAFAFCTVLSFPYFVPCLQEVGYSTLIAGAFFAVPHGVYLLLGWFYSRCSERQSPLLILRNGFVNLMLCFLAQALSTSWPALVVSRLLMGVAMMQCFIALNRLMSAACVQQLTNGRLFGKLDSAAKWGSVSAGVLAAASSHFFGLSAPFWLAAAAASSAVMCLCRHISASKPVQGSSTHAM